MTLEELLNMLCTKGWKPFGNEKVYKIKVCKIKLLRPEKEIIRIELSKGRGEAKGYTTVRAICSKESGLWQFVCENGMVKTGRVFISWTKNASCDDYGNLFWDKACPKDFYEYRLIESALKDESKLESFILDNIKIGNI